MLSLMPRRFIKLAARTMNGALYALSGSDGSVIWQQPFAQTTDSSSIWMSVSGTLYIETMTGTDADDGFSLYPFLTQRWKRTLEDEPNFVQNGWFAVPQFQEILHMLLFLFCFALLKRRMVQSCGRARFRSLIIMESSLWRMDGSTC